MTDMIDQLLDLTRARLAGGLGFERVRKRLDVAALVQRSVEELRVAHPEREVLVSIEGDGATAGDPDRLLQVFSNLIANAIQHGAARTAVRVDVRSGEHDIVVCVKNQGVIPQEIMPTIFAPFQGRRSRSSSSRGLGLGLFISQQIAVAHGGSVEVESSEESGTTFVVHIPRRLAEAKMVAPNGHQRTVLIVDDDEDIRDSLREAFEEEGYEADTAANGAEALELLTRKAPPGVVILDLVLPVMDGSRVYQAMQADASLANIPVIVSTSNPARAPSGVVVIPKPLKLDRLLDTVAELWSPQS
jgi:CheY-like chemotaxis protein